MLKRSLLRREWLAAVVFFTFATSLLSQESTESIAETERVIVVGSHIPTAEEVGPNPIQDISREQIEKAGDRTAADLLRRLPIDGFAGVPTTNNGFGQFGPAGASSVALRGFDASGTLVLLDGRRLAPYPLGAPPTGAVAFVDLSSIPKAALESVEILKDSASAIYGADAVAGVVNLKFRHDYRGAELSSSYGNTASKDSGEETGSLVFGVGDDLTNVTGVLSYYHRNGIFDRDRAFIRTGFRSSDASPINLRLSRAAVLAAGVPASQLPLGPNGRPASTFLGHAPFFTDGLAPASDYVYGRRATSLYDVNLDAQAVPDSERYGGYQSMTRKVLGDQLQLYVDLFFQKVDTHYVLSPTATAFFQTPGQTTLAIPPHASGPVIAGPTYEETGVPLGAYNPFNPFQQIISGSSRARLVEFGDRIGDNVTEAFFTTAGIKGDKLFGGNWGYDAGFRYSRVQNNSRFFGVSASRFNRILNAADPIFNPSSPEYIGTTIPYNPFGDYRRPIASNSFPVDFATVNVKDVDTSSLATFDLNIYTTSLFHLPAGGVGLAFGGHFRSESLKVNPDPLEIRGDVLGGTTAAVISANGEAYAFYAELSVPIVSSANPLPGIRALEFTAAGRFEEFRNNGSNVLVPKVGVRWQPLDESLTIRATWGEGFHQPSLLELFANPIGATIADDGSVIDPVTGQSAGEFTAITRGNPNLQPEDSRSFSGGVVYTPKFLHNLTLSLDLWDIESQGRAFIPDVQDVINRSVTGQLLPLEKVTRDADGNIVLVDLAFQNAGSRKARGIDLGLSYELATPIGTFTSVTQVTYFDSLKFAQTSNSPVMELVRNGDFTGSNTSPLRWKGNSALDWSWREYSAGLTGYYLDGFHETLFAPDGETLVKHWVSQTWLFDVRASYSFHAPKSVDSRWERLLDGTTLAVGCNNVFDRDPPRAGQFPRFPASLYDLTGRFYYIKLTKKF